MPAVWSILIAAVAVSLLAFFGNNLQMVGLFNLSPLDVYGTPLPLEMSQFWRFFSAPLLHFGILHLVFNAAFIYLLGRSVEQREGAVTLLALVAITSMVALVSEYAVQGPQIIGGLSGGVYGLAGYCLLRTAPNNQRLYALPPGLMFMLLLNLALGFLGVLDALLGAAVANYAHLGGLLSGLLLARLAPTRARQ